jgi:hypothetical protein
MWIYTPGPNPAFAPPPTMEPGASSGGALRVIGAPVAGVPIQPNGYTSLPKPTAPGGLWTGADSDVWPWVMGSSIYVQLPNGLGPWNGVVTTGASHYNVYPVPATPGAAAQPLDTRAGIPRGPAPPSVATMPWPRVVAIWPLRGKSK